MTESAPITYSQPAVELGDLDHWLYEANPVPGCRDCTTAARKLDLAEKAGRQTERFELARFIREHRTHGSNAATAEKPGAGRDAETVTRPLLHRGRRVR